MIKFQIFLIVDQLYIFPFMKLTHNRELNGDLELIIGWLKWEFVIGM